MDPSDIDEQDMRRRIRDRIRARLREIREFTASEEGETARMAWLARYGLIDRFR